MKSIYLFGLSLLICKITWAQDKQDITVKGLHVSSLHPTLLLNWEEESVGVHYRTVTEKNERILLTPTLMDQNNPGHIDRRRSGFDSKQECKAQADKLDKIIRHARQQAFWNYIDAVPRASQYCESQDHLFGPKSYWRERKDPRFYNKEIAWLSILSRDNAQSEWTQHPSQCVIVNSQCLNDQYDTSNRYLLAVNCANHSQRVLWANTPDDAFEVAYMVMGHRELPGRCATSFNW